MPYLPMRILHPDKEKLALARKSRRMIKMFNELLYEPKRIRFHSKRGYRNTWEVYKDSELKRFNQYYDQLKSINEEAQGGKALRNAWDSVDIHYKGVKRSLRNWSNEAGMLSVEYQSLEKPISFLSKDSLEQQKKLQEYKAGIERFDKDMGRVNATFVRSIVRFYESVITFLELTL